MAPASSDSVTPDKPKHHTFSEIYPHVILAGIANSAGQTVGHPFDLLKLRLQIQGRGVNLKKEDQKYRGVIGGLRTIVQDEGYVGLFSAWRISVAREFWYSGLRVGLYEPVKEFYGATDPSKTTIRLKIAAGLTSGTIASCLSNPLDLLKVRYQAAIGEDYKKLSPPLTAFRDLAQQGPKAMWRGFMPNTCRAAGITATQLASYDHIKHTFLNHKILEEGKVLHFITSVIASIISIVVTNPVDVLKTRMMNFPNEGNMREVAVKVLKQEGWRAFYKGAFLAWLRLGPHTVVSFVTFEELRKLAGIKPL
jgi:hypothetical protein